MLRTGLVAILITAQIGAVVAAPLAAETYQNFGGIYSAKCGDATADKAIITRDALIFKRASRDVVALDVEEILSSYGSAPPEDFQLTLMGRIAANTGLAFDVYKSRASRYLRVNGHPDAMKLIHQRDDEVKFVFCGRSAF